jgi:hypothetical protein
VAWTTAAAAKAHINGLAAAGQTDYDAALGATKTALQTLVPPFAADQTLVYFVSDGGPNRPFGSVGVQGAEETSWETVLFNEGVDKAFAVGIDTTINEGAGPSFNSPDDFVDIAFNGDNNTATESLDTLFELTDGTNTDPLSGTLPTAPLPVVSGNVLNDNGSGADMPGDGPIVITKITVGMTNHVDDGDGKIEVTLDDGKLTFYFTDNMDGHVAGDFVYEADADFDGDSFSYMIQDDDLEMSTATVSIVPCEDGTAIKIA